MAYYLHHTITFYNPLTEKKVIELYKKDDVPDSATNLKALGFTQTYPNGEGDKFDKIVSCQVKFDILLRESDSIDYDDLIITYTDEWKVIAYTDDVKIFEGFLVPGENLAPMQNKKNKITLTGTDALGLLKGVPLTDVNGDNFVGPNFIIDYLVAIFQKTGLQLPILVFSSWLEDSLPDRAAFPLNDTVNQYGIHARTFLKDPIEFVDCYQALEVIVKEVFSVYQFQGKWVVSNIGEMQQDPGPKRWLTNYDYQGNVLSVQQLDHQPCKIARNNIIFPIDQTAFVGSRFALKYARTSYNYSVWPELPTNNKFDRGDRILPIFGNVYAKDVNGNDTADQIGTYEGYDIDNWTKGDFTGSPSAVSSLPALSAPTGTFARISSYNNGNEFEREISISNTGGSSKASWLQSEAFGVNKGDRFNFNVDVSLSYNYSFPGSNPSPLTLSIAYVYIIANDGSKWSLRYRQSTNKIDNVWLKAGIIQTISVTFQTSDATKKFANISVESPTIPVDGTMYIVLANPNQDTLATPPYIVYFKKFNFEYRPFIAGGYLPVNGDYWQTSQDQNLLDKSDEEIFLSDTPKAVLKGALYQNDLSTLTTKTWRRFGIDESRGFKELANLSRFNHAWRRMWTVEGTFAGLRFTPSNNTTYWEPLSFHRHFFFPDVAKFSGRYFMLVPPLTIDHNAGRFQGKFIECLNENDSSIGAITIGQIVSQLIVLVNNDAPGLTFAGNHADPDKLVITCEDATTVITAANDNGVGNSPSLTVISTVNIPGPFKQITIQVGPDIQPGNSFTIAINATPLTVTATSLVVYADGNKTGNSHYFKYIFR